MASHLEHLLSIFPDIKNGKILDIGIGDGEFVTECYEKGFDVQGIEINKERVARIKHKFPDIEVVEGVAEALPYADQSFDFINVCEVIEHVQNPKKVLEEVRRVLAPEGKAYVSFPNRFSFYDTHYHVFFVNWLPRAWADAYIRVIGKDKGDSESGLQKLSEMHYYTMFSFRKLAASCGLVVEDTRARRLRGKPFLMLVYKIIAPVYFRASHTVLRRA